MSDITETKQLERSKQRWQSEGELPSLFGSRPEMITHTQKVDSSVLRVRVRACVPGAVLVDIQNVTSR